MEQQNRPDANDQAAKLAKARKLTREAEKLLATADTLAGEAADGEAPDGPLSRVRKGVAHALKVTREPSLGLALACGLAVGAVSMGIDAEGAERPTAGSHWAVAVDEDELEGVWAMSTSSPPVATDVGDVTMHVFCAPGKKTEPQVNIRAVRAGGGPSLDAGIIDVRTKFDDGSAFSQTFEQRSVATPNTVGDHYQLIDNHNGYSPSEYAAKIATSSEVMFRITQPVGAHGETLSALVAIPIDDNARSLATRALESCSAPPTHELVTHRPAQTAQTRTYEAPPVFEQAGGVRTRGATRVAQYHPQVVHPAAPRVERDNEHAQRGAFSRQGAMLVGALVGAKAGKELSGDDKAPVLGALIGGLLGRDIDKQAERRRAQERGQER